MPRTVAGLALGLLGWATVAVAQTPGVDPTPETTPDIELDGSIGPGGDVSFEGGIWQIGEDLGEYSSEGTSLFHSFGRFNVSTGDAAQFSALNGSPERIYARVTWGEVSDIKGTIQVLPDADLYLINPAGIEFSGGASVDVQGSFYATTASRIDFESIEAGGPSEGSLPAYGSIEPSSFTFAAPSAFGFLPTAEGLSPDSGEIRFGALSQALRVPVGETFAAIGERVSVVVDPRFPSPIPVFVSPGSRIALIAAAPNVDVPHSLETFNPEDVDPSIVLGDVLVSYSQIKVSRPAGSILVRGGNFEVTAKSLLAVVHDDSGAPNFPVALDVVVQNEIRIDGNSTINVDSVGGGKGGDIVFAGRSLSISGRSTVSAFTEETDDGESSEGSDFKIFVDDFAIADRSRLISRNRLGTNVGSEIAIINARNVSLTTGGRIISETTGSGQGGAIKISADQLSISDQGISPLGTHISATTTGDSDSRGGDISLVVGDLEIDSGGQVFASTTSASSAGSVRIVATTINVSGLVESGGVVRPSSIEVRALEGSSGSAGSEQLDESILGISLDADRIEIKDGALVGTFTKGSGPAGDVVVTGDSLQIAGGDLGPALVFSRAFAPQTGPDVGDSGDVRIDITDDLELKNGGHITTTTSGTGDAGLIYVTADNIEILGTDGFNASGLFSQTNGTGSTGMGAGGQIEVEARGEITLRDGAGIAVETRNDADAGDISIIAGEGVLLTGDASISANSTQNATGRAGSITIDAGPSLVMVDSSITTDSLAEANPGGGEITIIADELVSLTNSSIDASVLVSRSGGDGGSVFIDPDLVILNSSSIRANAEMGDGGRIFIRAGSFVMSADSVVESVSKSGVGIDGEVIIESPDSDLVTGSTQPPQQFLDASGLMKTACAARSSTLSSLVVTQIAGLPATPHGPLPSRLWDDAWLEKGRAEVARAIPDRMSNDGALRLASHETAVPHSEVIR